MGRLNSFLASGGGNLNKNSIARGGRDVEASIWLVHYYQHKCIYCRALAPNYLSNVNLFCSAKNLKLDLCYFYGLPKHLLNRLRSIQNTAARIVTLSKRFDHITPIMFKLHWLPLNYRILFKILLLVPIYLNYRILFKILFLAPIYLSELLSYSNSPRLLRSIS